MTRQSKGRVLASGTWGGRYLLLTTWFSVPRISSSLTRGLVLLALGWVFAPTLSLAQSGAFTGGWVLQLIGMVQVEPGPNVVTLGVKSDVIRFTVNDVHTRDQNFSVPQFLAEIRRREPSLEVRGQEALLDLLLKEKPSKRVLKLTGRYYQDSRRFILDDIDRLENTPTPR